MPDADLAKQRDRTKLGIATRRRELRILLRLHI